MEEEISKRVCEVSSQNSTLLFWQSPTDSRRDGVWKVFT